MRKNWNPQLEARVRDANPTARDMVDLRIEPAADLRQTPGGLGSAPWGWRDADNWSVSAGGFPAISSLVEIMDDGGLRLKASGASAQGPTTASAFYRSYEGGTPTTSYIDPVNQSGRGGVGILAQFKSGPMGPYSGAQAWLHPRYDPTKPKYVRTWQFNLYAVGLPVTVGTVTYYPITLVAQGSTRADGEVAGWVVFNFQTATGAPFLFYPGDYVPQTRGVAPASIQYFLVVNGLDATGAPATNVGWGYDTGNTSFTIPGSGSAFATLTGSVAAIQPGNPGLVTLNTSGIGGSIGICALQLLARSFSTTAVTILFKTGKPINLGSAPASPPELVLSGTVPSGTLLTGQVYDNSGGQHVFTDGQLTSYPGAIPLGYYNLGLPTQQTYAVQATLQADAGGLRSPVLDAIGARAVASVDVSDLVRVTSWQERIDPLTHVAEVGQATIAVIKGGERDFNSRIETLLSRNPPGQMSVRIWTGDASLSRSLWIRQDDFFVDDIDPRGGDIGITGVSALAFLRQALPKLTSDVSAVPASDVSNTGAWTASVGSLLYPQLADVSALAATGAPDDTTYIQSPSNPSAALYEASLSAIGTPASLVGVTIQWRAAVAAAGQSVALQLTLLEGVTTRAVLPGVTVTVADAGQGSYTPYQLTLTPAQAAAIGNWANLNLQFSASGTGQVRVGWARLVVLGGRPPLVYPSAATPGSTVGAVMTDLLLNQVGLDGRYVGAPYIDPSSPLPVGKTMQTSPSGETTLTRAKDELDALAWIGGWAYVSNQGRIDCVPLYAVQPGIDLISGSATAVYSPLGGPVAAVFPLDEVIPLAVSPGWRQRIPLYDVPWGWNGSVYAGEAQMVNQIALENFQQGLIDPERRAPTTVAQWITSQGLANGLAVRHSSTFGLGLPEWRFRTRQAHPELSLGDVVAVAVDRFLSFDPIAGRALAGVLWAFGVLVGRWSSMGTEWSIWVQRLSRVVPIATAGQGTPIVVGPPSDNLVLNGGFEAPQNLWYWANYGVAPAPYGLTQSAVSARGAPAYAGAFMGLLSDGSLAGGQDVYAWPTTVAGGLVNPAPGPPLVYPNPRFIAVRPGSTLNVSAAADTSGASAELYFVYYDSTGALLGTSPATLSWAVNAPLALQSALYVVPAGSSFVLPVLHEHNSGGLPHNGSAAFDAVSVSPLAVPVTNWCLQSQALATSPWFTTLLTATNNAATAPDGSNTATSLIPTAANGQHIVEQADPITPGECLAISGFFKADGYNYLTIKVDGVTGNATAAFDLNLGVVSWLANFGSGYFVQGASIAPVGNGWYFCAVWSTSLTDASVEPTIVVYDTWADATGQTAYTANGTSGIFAWGVQLERDGGIVKPATGVYAPTTTSPATVGR